MAVTHNVYAKYELAQNNGSPTNWADNVTTTIKVALITDSYTPGLNTDEFADDVLGVANANEASGTGYSAGGEALTNRSVVQATNVIKLDGDDFQVTITGQLTARYALVYKYTGDLTTSPVIGLVDFGEDRTAENSTFDIVWGANGVLTKTV